MPARQGGLGSIAGFSDSGINELKNSFCKIFKQEQFSAARRAAQGECLNLGHSGPELTADLGQPPAHIAGVPAPVSARVLVLAALDTNGGRNLAKLGEIPNDFSL